MRLNVDLVLIDGPNAYSDIGAMLQTELADPSLYLKEWFDFDRLVAATLDTEDAPLLGSVVFHSERKLGRPPYDIKGTEHITAFWARQGANPNTSCLSVVIPGDLREHFKCEKCETVNQINSTEKGVDTAMVVYSFETISRWESICLFTRDADFVPAVLSLRRLGKRVYVSAPSPSSDGLVRSSQSFLPLSQDFLFEDRAIFDFLRKDGGLDKLTEQWDSMNATYRIEHIGWRPSPFQHAQLSIILDDKRQPRWNDANTLFHKAVSTASIGRFSKIEDHQHTGIALRLARGNKPLVRDGIFRHLAVMAAAAWFPRASLVHPAI